MASTWVAGLRMRNWASCYEPIDMYLA